MDEGRRRLRFHRWSGSDGDSERSQFGRCGDSNLDSNSDHRTRFRRRPERQKSVAAIDDSCKASISTSIGIGLHIRILISMLILYILLRTPAQLVTTVASEGIGINNSASSSNAASGEFQYVPILDCNQVAAIRSVPVPRRGVNSL